MMVRHALLLLDRWLGCTNVQVAKYLYGIVIDDLPREMLGEKNRQVRFATGGGTNYCDNRVHGEWRVVGSRIFSSEFVNSAFEI